MPRTFLAALIALALLGGCATRRTPPPPTSLPRQAEAPRSLTEPTGVTQAAAKKDIGPLTPADLVKPASLDDPQTFLASPPLAVWEETRKEQVTLGVQNDGPHLTFEGDHARSRLDLSIDTTPLRPECVPTQDPSGRWADPGNPGSSPSYRLKLHYEFP